MPEFKFPSSFQKRLSGFKKGACFREGDRLTLSRFIIFFFIALFFLAPLAQAQNSRRDPFQILFPEQGLVVAPGGGFEFDIQFVIPPDHYLYDGKTSIMLEKSEGLELLRSDRPTPKSHFDNFFQKNLNIQDQSFTQKLFFHVPQNLNLSDKTLELSIRYQGCNREFCFRPVTKKLSIPVTVASAVLENPISQAKVTLHSPGAPQPSFWDLLWEANPDRLLNQGRIYLLALAFVAGILTSLTPCVLPIIPLTLAFIGIQQGRRGNLLRACYLVAGMVLMYSLLGFLAATLGLSLGFLFQNSYFTLFVALFFLLFSLALFGVLHLQIPSKMQNRLTQMGGQSGWGSFVAGLTIGLIASPCVGPLIAPLLLIASRSQDRFYGFLLLLNYGMGMGLLFLLLSLGFAELKQKLRSGRWTHLLKRFLACIMLIPAFYYGYAFLSTQFFSPKDGFWIYNFDQGLQKAKQTQKPMLLDFYANWCPPCIELDHKTFSDPQLRELSQSFVMVKVDCSVNDSNCQKATERFEVVGWPTVLFLTSEGELIPDVVWSGGFADKEKMMQLMKQALEHKRP